MDSLYKYFNNNNALLRKIIAYLRTIAKIRLTAHKIKGIQPKKQTTFLDDTAIPMWYPLANRNYNGYSEIIIAEGDSAAVAVDNARNSTYQAIFGVMGVVSNTHGMNATEVISSCKVFSNLVNILGCGIGKDFDISKLRYNKIIIETDADADGSNITSLLLLFFALYLPELILQGKVYKALPPLLKLDEKSVRKWYKGSLYLFSKEEYYDVINTIISDNVELAIPEHGNKKNVNPLKKKDARKWLKMNSEYTSELSRLEARTACDPSILEAVCYAKLSTSNKSEFKKMIEREYPEMTFDTHDDIFSGSNNGESVTLIIDSIFWRAAKKFMHVLEKNDSLWIYAKNRNSDSDKFKLYTIGEFLFLMEKTYNVRINQRFKGLTS